MNEIHELLQFIKLHKIQPHEIEYNVTDSSIQLGYQKFHVDNPRLAYAHCLKVFEIPITMYQRHFSSIAANTIYDERKVQIGWNCVIGGVGFGYERQANGELFQMPHIGNVEIQDNVTIHNNVCIDRAVVGSTIIGEGTKIDNLVHVGHGAIIGKNCLIVAGTVLGGRCNIDDNTFVGMNASILQHIEIGENCIIGAGAVVTKNIPSGQIWAGNPAKFIRNV